MHTWACPPAVSEGITWREIDGLHQFRLYNAGPAAAHEIRYWVATESGEKVTAASRIRRLSTDEDATVTLDVPKQPADTEAMWLNVAWTDSEQREERLVDV